MIPDFLRTDLEVARVYRTFTARVDFLYDCRFWSHFLIKYIHSYNWVPLSGKISRAFLWFAEIFIRKCLLVIFCTFLLMYL